SVTDGYYGIEEAEYTKMLMTDEEEAVFDKFYTVSETEFAEEVYVLDEGISEEELASLETMLTENTAVLSLYVNENGSFEGLNEENAVQIKESKMAYLLTSGEENVKNTALTFMKNMYEEMGVDVNKMQISYLKSKGLNMIILALAAMIASIISGFCASKISASTGRDLRIKVFEKVLGFSNAEMNSFSTASLITRCTNDIQQIQQITGMMFRIVMFAPVMAVGGIIMAVSTNVSLSWIIALAVLVLLSLVGLLMCIAMPKFKIMQTLIDNLNLVAREILTGIPVIRAFSREKFEEERFDKANARLMKTQLFTNRTMTFMMPSMTLIMNGTAVLIVLMGAKGANEGTMMVGDIMAFISYAMHIIMSFMFITMISIMLPRAVISAERIEEVLKVENEIKNAEATVEPEKIIGKVEFRNVTFRYSDSDENVLENVSFTAMPGETTALIGSTGSGKSTAVSLIPRLYDVSEGAILFDDVDIKDMDMKTLRKNIGFVPQKGILFSGTIKSNILFGEEDDEELMKKAAQIAQAEEFIFTKEGNYESHIAQGGVNVSGGQKQRLSIARAIARQPKVYIFDDSFSALDYKTDKILRKALKENVSNSTVIIVAQRISTILHAEKIVVLDDGKVVGVGTHDELMKNCEVYRQIALSQLSQKELGENE
ncbi:MAG: ABC transporter ATP-binding protein, partial [Firmicutes bacterium]|nr:ABC transporter ATP-binding protein [Bacillota bacterium]